ncbi:hypothetical protein [Planktothrix agardhii]|jgi:hypothetical protein|uniref:Uncharacterized protein n=1 Tax=Planktothrix agardhii TaxID=1160 RepID=A0AAD1Q3X8_PLAAG|nr:hypothetical protein [Planktothrix agardhii]CAD5945956.1 hypothetical protein PANO66_02291 [Planktothrix agardhii]
MKNKDWIKILRSFVKFIPLEKDRSWIEKRLIVEEQLLEQKQNDLLKLGEFLIIHPELSFKESLKEYLKKLEDEDIKPK